VHIPENTICSRQYRKSEWALRTFPLFLYRNHGKRTDENPSESGHRSVVIHRKKKIFTPSHGDLIIGTLAPAYCRGFHTVYQSAQTSYRVISVHKDHAFGNTLKKSQMTIKNPGG
jgi:hypothetical protein